MRALPLVIIALIALALPVAHTHAQTRPTLAQIPQQSAFATPGAVDAAGGYVVWAELVQEGRFTRYANLYASSSVEPGPFPLAERLAYDEFGSFRGPGFALGETYAVWADHPTSGPSSGLVAQRLGTGERRVLTTAPVAHLAMADELLAYWESPLWATGTGPGQATLMLLDLSRAEETRALAAITLDAPYLLSGVRLSPQWVVFARGDFDQGPDRAPCWSFWAVPTRGGEPRKVADRGCGQEDQNPTISVWGDTAAFTDGDGLLKLVDLRTGQVVSQSGPHGNVGQELNGRYVFWVTSERELWGYDPASDSAFLVDRGVASFNAAVSNGTVSWFDTEPAERFVLRNTLITDTLPTSPRLPNDPFISGRTLFTETGHTLGGAFRDYWQRNGGLAVFGYPLTEEFVQRAPGEQQGFAVQYLERQRFEHHPENEGTPYNVLLGRLGAETLGAAGRDWRTFPKADPSTPYYFAETGHSIAPEFWDYWRSNGLELGDAAISEREALALWGYPISPVLTETIEGRSVRVQWFERARFEFHPENPDPYKVLLGRLAAERVSALRWP